MTPRSRCVALALLLSSVVASTGGAQGNLSTQGFGYPPGQLSTRGLATGGAVAETDPQGATNPAALALWQASVLFGQYDPEFRRVNVANGGSARTVTARFPNMGASFRLGQRVAAGLHVSTYLDRTWSTRFEGPQVVGVDTVTATNILQSQGAISDLRAALAYAVRPNVSFGVGAHFFSGENRLSRQQTYPDTVRFAGVLENSEINYGGLAVSAGFEARIRRAWHVAASARYGGDITAESADTTLSRARIPHRYGAGISYQGIGGTVLSARASFEEWTALQPLGTSSMTTFDAWDFGAGADVSGPRVGRRVITLRAGARHRTLPFAAGGQKVNEISFSTGFGIPISINRAALDLAVVRASREAAGALTSLPGSGTPSGDVSETGYTLSIGLVVRP